MRSNGHCLFVGDDTGAGQPVADAFDEHGLGDLLIGPEGGFDPEEMAELRAPRRRGADQSRAAHAARRDRGSGGARMLAGPSGRRMSQTAEDQPAMARGISAARVGSHLKARRAGGLA